MKVGIGINIPQSETHGTLELETNTKKEVKNCKEMEDLHDLLFLFGIPST